MSLCFISADQYRIPSREEQEAVMDSFSSPSVGSGSSNFSSSELMDQVKTQLAQAYAQEFLEVSFLTLYAISMLLFTFTFSCCFSISTQWASGSYETPDSLLLVSFIFSHIEILVWSCFCFYGFSRFQATHFLNPSFGIETFARVQFNSFLLFMKEFNSFF